MPQKLTDNVIARLAQIVQEGILLGVDVVDLMRQIEVEVTPDGANVDLTESYMKSVRDGHQKLLDEADTLASTVPSNKIIFS